MSPGSSPCRLFFFPGTRAVLQQQRHSIRAEGESRLSHQPEVPGERPELRLGNQSLSGALGVGVESWGSMCSSGSTCGFMAAFVIGMSMRLCRRATLRGLMAVWSGPGYAWCIKVRKYRGVLYPRDSTVGRRPPPPPPQPPRSRNTNTNTELTQLPAPRSQTLRLTPAADTPEHFGGAGLVLSVCHASGLTGSCEMNDTVVSTLHRGNRPRGANDRPPEVAAERGGASHPPHLATGLTPKAGVHTAAGSVQRADCPLAPQGPPAGEMLCGKKSFPGQES